MDKNNPLSSLVNEWIRVKLHVLIFRVFLRALTAATRESNCLAAILENGRRKTKPGGDQRRHRRGDCALDNSWDIETTHLTIHAIYRKQN